MSFAFALFISWKMNNRQNFRIHFYNSFCFFSFALICFVHRMCMYGTLPLLVPAVVKPQLSTAKIRDLDQDLCIHSVVIVELF